MKIVYVLKVLILLRVGASLGHLLGYKKTYKVERQFLVGSLLRRALDSNQRIPYDIGSLANCWFKPLTQPSLNHLFSKEWCKYTTYFHICKILPEIFSLAYRNALCAIDIWCGAMWHKAKFGHRILPLSIFAIRLSNILVLFYVWWLKAIFLLSGIANITEKS